MIVSFSMNNCETENRFYFVKHDPDKPFHAPFVTLVQVHFQHEACMQWAVDAVYSQYYN